MVLTDTAIALCVDGPAKGELIRIDPSDTRFVFRESMLGTQAPNGSPQGSRDRDHVYELRLLGDRHWPFVRATFILICDEENIDTRVLDETLEQVDWQMYTPPSFLFEFDLWWVWMMSKFWLEHEWSNQEESDFWVAYHNFRIKRCPHLHPLLWTSITAQTASG